MQARKLWFCHRSPRSAHYAHTQPRRPFLTFFNPFRNYYRVVKRHIRLILIPRSQKVCIKKKPIKQTKPTRNFHSSFGEFFYWPYTDTHSYFRTDIDGSRRWVAAIFLLALRQTLQIQEGNEHSFEVLLWEQKTVFLQCMSGCLLLQSPPQTSHATSTLQSGGHLWRCHAQKGSNLKS